PDLARLPVAARRLLRIAGARAVDEDALLAVRRARLCKARRDAFVVRHVHFAEHAANLGGDLLALVLLPVEERDLDAALGERARRRLAEAGRAAGDDGHDR